MRMYSIIVYRISWI